jgi:hypothetical protein
MPSLFVYKYIALEIDKSVLNWTQVCQIHCKQTLTRVVIVIELFWVVPSRGRIFSRVRPFYEQAVSDRDP